MKSPRAKLAYASTLKEGNRAPAFHLEMDGGEKVRLADFKGKTVVLYFYPKDMTSGCTQQACDFRDSFALLKKKGAIILGVSKDSVKSHDKFKAKYSLPFPLLSDPEGKVCEAYGVWKEKSMYGRKYMGIVRSTWLIGEDGVVKHVWPKVKAEGHAAEVIAALDRTAQAAAAVSTVKAKAKPQAKRKAPAKKK